MAKTSGAASESRELLPGIVLHPQIAQTPAEPRDSARLLVLHRAEGRTEHRHFREVGDYLEPGDVLVLNQTRVIPARLHGHKVPSGGQVELLLLRRYLMNAQENGAAAVSDRMLCDILQRLAEVQIRLSQFDDALLDELLRLAIDLFEQVVRLKALDTPDGLPFGIQRRSGRPLLSLTLSTQ